MKIIGITGTYGAGKGTIVEYLKTKGFTHFSVSEDYLTPEIEKRGLPVNRDSMILVANEIREQQGPGFIVSELYKRAKESGKDTIIESIRCLGEIKALRELGEFILLAVDADQKIRYDRVTGRKSSKDNVTFDDFKAKEKYEMKNEDPNKQSISKCMDEADYIINNDSNVEELNKNVEAILNDI